MDWVAFAGVIVAVIAATITVVALRVQRDAHQLSVKQRYVELTMRIQDAMASGEGPGVGVPSRPEPGAPPLGDFTLKSIQNLAIQAEELEAEGRFEPTWLDSLTVAVAFTHSWDLDSALPHWEQVGRHITDKALSPAARTSCLTARARFHLVRGADGDLARCREDMDQALRISSERVVGPGISDSQRDQLTLIHIRYADIELAAGNPDGCAAQLGQAYRQALELGPSPRGERAVGEIARFIVVRVPHRDVQIQLRESAINWRPAPDAPGAPPQPLQAAFHFHAGGG